MSDFIKPIAEWCAAIIEALGIGLMIVFTFYALLYAIFQLFTGVEAEAVFRRTRQSLGRGILLGLEVLIVADIIHTVAVELTFTTVSVLAIIVVIRTFLSIALNVELNGRWPWQHNEKERL